MNVLFAEFDHGSPLMVSGDITYSIGTNGEVETFFLFHPWTTSPVAIHLGDYELADELFSRQTPRAVAWANSLQVRKDDPDGIAVRTIEAIRFSIENHPAIDVGNGMTLRPIGGPIDAVRLSPKGIEWLQRKPNCPKN